jgi:hypothetical protein
MRTAAGNILIGYQVYIPDNLEQALTDFLGNARKIGIQTISDTKVYNV